MPNWLFLGLFLSVILAIGVVATILLIWPGFYLRKNSNPLVPNTPENRVQMRGVGICFILFVLMVISGIVSTHRRLEWMKTFHNYILGALWISPIAITLFCWILWMTTIKSHNRYLLVEGLTKDPKWERKITIISCLFLASIIAVASLLAAKSSHHR